MKKETLYNITTIITMLLFIPFIFSIGTIMAIPASVGYWIAHYFNLNVQYGAIGACIVYIGLMLICGLISDILEDEIKEKKI